MTEAQPDPPSPSEQKKQAVRQARMNVCLVIAITLASVLVLSFVLVGTGVFLLMRSPEKTIDSATSASNIADTQSPDAIPSVLTTDTIAGLTDVQNLKEGDVGKALYAPDGTTLAIGMGHDIMLYDPRTMDIALTLRGHEHTVNALVFVPVTKPGRKLLLASSAVDEQNILVWDVDAAQPLLLLEGHTGWVRSLACSSDGAFIASGSTDRTIRLWDAQRGTLVHVLNGHTDAVSDLAFSPDSTLLASTSRDGTMRLWDVEKGKEISIVTHEPRPFFALPPGEGAGLPLWTTGVGFSPDGALIAVGSTDGTVRILSATTAQVVQTLEGHSELVVIGGVAFSPDGRVLASASVDGTVRLWDSTSGKSRGVLDHRGMQVRSISWSPDGTVLVSSSDTSGEVLFWDAADAQLIQTLPLAQGPLLALTYSLGGTLLGTGGSNGTIRLWNVADNNQITLANGVPSANALAFLDDTTLVAATDDEAGRVMIVDTQRRREPRVLQGMHGAVISVAVSPDREKIAIGTKQNELSIWDVQSGELLATFDGPGGALAWLAFLNDSTTLVAGTEAGRDDATATSAVTAVWDTTAGNQEPAHIRQYNERITGLAVQPGGDVVATTSEDGSLTVWSGTDGQERMQQQASNEQGWFTCVAFSPDGTMLAAGAADGSITFWDMATGKEVHQAMAGGGGVLAVAFRPDGAQLAVSVWTGGVQVYEVRQK